ncbi:T9SS type A sorting domain-containing protein, partial [Sphingobacteriaceae bacterium AH-315-L07]|nr:T9SS type A sorting domain-containing protein [Sphingobacteriaceae bacterium AH-315-L07]
TARWMLVNETDNDTVFADSTIDYPNEQLIINHCVNINSDKKCSEKVNWGLMVSVSQVLEPGVAKDDENGVQSTSTIVFEQGSKPWLTGIPDQDGINPFYNWILSGKSTETNWQDIGCDNNNCLDPEGAFENILNGTWAPYRMCSYQESYTEADGSETFYYAPIYNDGTMNRRGVELEDLANVDLVITSDKTKWSNSTIVELSESSSLAKNGVPKMQYIGQGQFPGYAIDLDKGKRLNIIFGEDSWWESENGGDSEWNPTENVKSDLSGSETSYLGGGKHWIYVMSGDNMGYDGGTYYKQQLEAGNVKSVYSEAMWVSMAHLEKGYSLLETDVTVKLRVDNAYHTDNSNSVETLKYSFSTDSICAIKQDAVIAKENLELINIVPNPYYSFSGYETSQIDNRVKFTNLPDQCTISIYDFSGALIEKLNKESSNAFIDWDLKNAAGVPVSSGIYIIHINVPDVGDKILKWFCVTRPIDLDTF